MRSKILSLATVIILSFGCMHSKQLEDGTKYSEENLKSLTQNENARELYNLGYAEFSKDNYNGAIDYYKKAVSIDPKYTDAIDNLALSYRRINNLDSAEKYYKQSLNVLPTNELAWNNLAVVYIHKGDLENAKSTFRKLISVNNKYGDAYYGMSEVFLRQENGDSAVYFGLKAYQIWKDSNVEFSGDALNYIVQGYLKTSNLRKAKEYFNIGKSIGTRFPDDIEKELNK